VTAPAKLSRIKIVRDRQQDSDSSDQAAKTRYRRGELLGLKVAASQNTRTLVARLEGAHP